MTDAQKLKALVEKAAESGWSITWVAKDTFKVWYFGKRHVGESTNGLGIKSTDYHLSKPEQFIFNHDFARALFGEGSSIPVGKYGGTLNDKGDTFTTPRKPGFEYHLQQAVILPTPSEQIDYVYKAVFGE